MAFNADVNHLNAGTASSQQLVQWIAWYISKQLQGKNTGGSIFVSVLWTVVSSSNGVTSSTSDLWNDTFTPSEIVQAPDGEAHSWVVLENDGSTQWLTIDCISEVGCSFVLSASAPTGGSETTRPTSLNEVVLNSSGQNIALTNGDTTVDQYVHMFVNNPLEDVYFYTSYTGSGRFYSMLALSKVDNYTTGDSYRDVGIFFGGGEEGLSTNPINASIFNLDSYGRPSRLQGLDFGGTTQVSLAVAAPAIYDGTSLLNPLTTTGYVNGDNYGSGFYNEFPLVAYSKFPNAGMKGQIRNIKLASGSLSEMSEKGTISSVKFGDCWVPWESASSPNV